MKMKEKDFYLLLSECEEIGFKRLKIIEKKFPLNLVFEKAELIREVALSKSIKEKILLFLKNKKRHQKILSFLKNFYTYYYKDYQSIFPNVLTLPLTLKGTFDMSQLPKYSIRIGMIGTTTPQKWTEKVIEKICVMLKDKHPLIISGFARGIDRLSHKYAVYNGIDTLSFVPYGIARIPQKYLQIKNLYFLSETPIFSKWKSKWAILRNRLIAGFSDIIIVIQSKIKGGSFHTVKYALKSNRKILAVISKKDKYNGNDFLVKKFNVIPVHCLSDIKSYIQSLNKI